VRLDAARIGVIVRDGLPNGLMTTCRVFVEMRLIWLPEEKKHWGHAQSLSDLLGYEDPKDLRNVLSFKACVLIINFLILSMLESADVKPLQGEIPP
jgi:hypothetical protein